MRYKVMRLLCMFDLPVETASEKRAYRMFRKYLLKEGFVMLQYSVYMRTCPNRDYVYALEKRMKNNVPSSGNIRLVSITEKQYNDMIFLVGNKNIDEALGSERMIVL